MFVTTAPVKETSVEMSPRPAYASCASHASHQSQLHTTLEPALRLASRGQLLLWSALSSLFLNIFLLTSVVLQLCQAAASALGRLAYASLWAVQAVWDSAHVRRLRKKVEFEFFTLILGAGGHVFLILLWPGWYIIGFAGFVLWIWCAK
ncbi:hypothetical protein F5Y17DRAFT_459921 [Xylariaceae sp. FL0594]|nr:hypothetical protein F5Y17DRAFT_459921 [Xylariaceae sp. FL0594]